MESEEKTFRFLHRRMRKAKKVSDIKGPHVVFIVSGLSYGGILNLVLGIATSSTFSKWKCSVIALLGINGDLAKEYRKAGIPLYSCLIQWPHRTHLIPPFIQNFIRKLTEKTFPWRMALLLRIIKADVVHTHTPRSIDLVSISTLKLCQLPLIWSIHGENVDFFGPRADGVKRATEMFIRSGKGVITTDSQALADGFLVHYPRIKEKIEVIYPGANIKRFLEKISKDPAWRRKLGISEHAIVFGACGRLSPEKGFDIFVQAASLLLEKNVEVHFVISGKGSVYNQLSEQISQLGLIKYFHLLGYQENLPFIYHQYDVFVLPSRTEGFPLALIEALAAGLPCIATDVGGVCELLRDEGGIIVQSESPESLSDAMMLMLIREIRNRYSSSATTIGQNYSFDNCASKFRDLYSLSLHK
jgi:glycosyltransferase involved in cell wall biosynthesis